MAVPVAQFVKQLEDSGILAGDTLKDFMPPNASPKDGEELARELVRKKKLTKFQAEEVYRGKGKALVLGNYTILDKIGAGGMGQVFKAEHRRMHRIVAVKMLPTGMMKNPAVVARFEREVTAAAKLNHPNIVTAFDADNANGVHLLIMEYVEGSDLSAWVKKNGPLPVAQAVNYILQTARGLEAAHAEGIVHRDIKPANLLLDKKGVVKILDMGLARLSDEADSVKQAELTNTGTIMGTVDYMAPEQALNTKTADARADIYSLGCSLFYLLTGKATYGGDTLMAKLLAHRDQPIPSIQAIRPEVPEAVEAVFNRMVAKRIEDRYQTMTEVIADLERLGTHQEQSSNTQSSLGSFADSGLSNFLNEISLAPSTPAKRPKGSFDKDWIKKNKRLLLIGGGLLCGLILLAGLVVSLRTKDGTLIVTVNEPDAEVQVLSEAGKVEITRKGEKGPISIWVVPGKHQLKVQKDGFVLITKDFEIESRGKKSISAKLVPLEIIPAVAEAKKSLAFETPGFDQWMKKIAPLSAEKQVEAVAKKLQELNPGFDGKVTHKGVWEVTDLEFLSDNVTDISPVRALPKLKILNCGGSNWGTGKLADLSPLKRMPLTQLHFRLTQVTDLSPLKGIPLTGISFSGSKVADLSPLKDMEQLLVLECYSTPVADLSPLKDLKLTRLTCNTTQVSDLSPLKDMKLTTLLFDGTKVSDLSPLQGMPLTVLGCGGTQVSDLSPLKGMPLESLGFNSTNVTDLSPLKDMPLKHLICDFKPFRDREILRSIKTLQEINNKPVADFWKEVDAKQTAFEAWTKQVAALSSEKQVEAVAKKLAELNPGFDGKVTPGIENGVVTYVQFLSDNVTDISPVRALKELRTLACWGSGTGLGKLADLTPLTGMTLSVVRIPNTQVTDLAPLHGMPLTQVDMWNTPVSDLTPLKDTKLTGLQCGSTRITDLSPLQGMPLTGLLCVTTQVSDLSPLRGMPLKRLSCDFKPERDTELLRSIKTLEMINDKPAADFWKEVEEKQSGKKP